MAEQHSRRVAEPSERERIVRSHDCIASLACEHGFHWETVWNHPQNAELKDLRKDPYVLLAGDRVVIPERTPKSESGATEQRHRFVRRGIPEELRIVLLDADGLARGDLSYMIDIEGELRHGTSSGTGEIRIPIPPGAQHGVLWVGEGDPRESYRLALGRIDPITEVTGVQARLNNLSFGCGPVDGVLGTRTRLALLEFQQAQGLPSTGDLDEKTRLRLRESHGF